MKTKLTVLMSAAALLCLALPVRADEVSDSEKSPRDRDEAHAQRMQHLGSLEKMNQIIGMEIKDSHGQKVGKVKDLVLDLQNGRIAEVIIGQGGVLGMDQKLATMPPQSFTYEPTMKALCLNVDREQLKNAPEFKMSQWQECTEDARVRETYQRFGIEPYFTRGQQVAPPIDLTNQRGHASTYYHFDPENALPRLGYLSRATRLMGTTTWNMENEKLGVVNNFVMDLPAGRVVELVLRTGSPLGSHEELRAVPPQAFRWNVDNTALTLDTTVTSFKAAPFFTIKEWDQATEPVRITEVYNRYRVEPYFATMDNGAQNVRERTGGKAGGKMKPSDLDTTERIRKDIQANKKLSADAKNVKIITAEGKVTLMGPVESQEERRIIGEVAAKHVSAEKVDNQLEVRATPLYTVPPELP